MRPMISAATATPTTTKRRRADGRDPSELLGAHRLGEGRLLLRRRRLGKVLGNLDLEFPLGVRLHESLLFGHSLRRQLDAGAAKRLPLQGNLSGLGSVEPACCLDY